MSPTAELNNQSSSNDFVSEADGRNLKNPYGGGPGTGISLPPYYRPTPYMRSNQVFFPKTEEVGPDEMRITFMGTSPWPPRTDQVGTCIMVELGNGERFFFDFGPGCMKNILAFQVPPNEINNIFLTHLHTDHMADIPYAFSFTPFFQRWNPMKIVGPSGRTPKFGTKAMCEGIKQMCAWHAHEFSMFPVGDGYEFEVTEFDYSDAGGVCYDQNGVKVRHWPRSHGMDGASGYRLDWNGLSFVWTGEGRPDKLTLEYAKGVDVFVTECQSDLGYLNQLKNGVPQDYWNHMIDTHHTPHYSLGYVMQQTQPRAAMVTHIVWEHDMIQEVSAGVRTHYSGLFLYGAPDGVVVNVTKDAVWSREASIPAMTGMVLPNIAKTVREQTDGKSLRFPPVDHTREDQQNRAWRDMEIDPSEYMPTDVDRPMITELPDLLKKPIAIKKLKAMFARNK